MSIRDRVTLRLIDGTEQNLTVTHMGGTVGFTWDPGSPRELVILRELNKGGQSIREIRATQSQVALVVRDVEPQPKKARARKPKGEAATS